MARAPDRGRRGHGTQAAPLARAHPRAGSSVVAVRRHTLLSLDDCLYALQPIIPALTRSSLHRCLQRHGISRLPGTEGDKPDKKRFKADPLGSVPIDTAEVRSEQGKLWLFVAIERTSKLAFVRLVDSAGKMAAAPLLRDLVKAVPDTIHTVLTDHAIQFTRRARDIHDSQPIFDRVCDEHGIEHRLTKVSHPWTNGQVERMNRTLKDATVKRDHYESHDELRARLQLFLDAYNHARRLKALRGLTPYEFTCRAWTQEPKRLRIEPSHHTLGLNRKPVAQSRRGRHIPQRRRGHRHAEPERRHHGVT